MIYVGIDPGNKGWFVAIDEKRDVYMLAPMPLVDIGKSRTRNVLDLEATLSILLKIKKLGKEHGGVFVAIERAQAMGAGGRRSAASARSMFGYGRSYGGLLMGLEAAGLDYEEVHPQTWGSKILKGVRGKNTKARSVKKAQQALPKLDLAPGRKRKPQDGIADAGCMALYATLVKPVAGVVEVTHPSTTQPHPPLPPAPPAPSRKTPPPPPKGKK